MSVSDESLEKLKIDREEEAREGRPSWLLLVLALIVVGVAGWWLAERSGTPEVSVAPVEVVDSDAPSTVLNASGYVVAREQATVASEVTGRITEVLVEEGDRVEKGELLATLDPSTSRRALELAEAQERAAASALEETRVRLDEARLELRRAQRLHHEGVGSEAEVDRALAEVEALEARLDRQRDELGVARRQTALRRQEVDERQIRAPFAGVVISKNAQAGEMISPMSAGGGYTRTGICTIVDMDSLEIEVDVNERYIGRVEPGQPVVARLDAYPDWEIPAHVIAIVPAADRQKATVKVRIAIDEEDPRILPDMGVEVAFVSTPEEGRRRATDPTIKTRYEVAATAVVERDDEDVVFVYTRGAVERRAVKVAERVADRVVLASGVHEGERVVVAPPERLTDGVRVRLAE